VNFLIEAHSLVEAHSLI